MIRPFASDDYVAFANIQNAIYPQHPTTAEGEREGDAEGAADRHRARWVIEGAAGDVVGVVEYRQREPASADYEFELFVHPACQGEGYGKRLYAHTLDRLAELQAQNLFADEVKEDLRGLRFLTERKFMELMRFWESRLDVTTFDATPYAPLLSGLQQQGIVIKTLRELQDEPEHDQRLYDLVCEASADVPRADAYIPPTYEEFCRDLPAANTNQSDMYFIALREDRYLGLHIMVPRDGTDHLRIAMTGVRRAYRRQGIALALKLHGIAYAAAHGHPVLRTMNATGNAAILALNDRLGFVWQPAWIQMKKAL
jgi:mycothiol synthase